MAFPFEHKGTKIMGLSQQQEPLRQQQSGQPAKDKQQSQWWLSVEFEKAKTNKNNFDAALSLLNAGNERYDITMGNGKTIARGIFFADCNYEYLASLIDMCLEWVSTAIFANGYKLDLTGCRQMSNLLKCASRRAYCMNYTPEYRLAFIGCHLMQIGFFDYRYEDLKSRNRTWWFSYFAADKTHENKFILDKQKLLMSLGITGLCPKNPENISQILSRLPASINLSTKKDFWDWVITQKRLRTRTLFRLPPVIPRDTKRYQNWVIKNFKDIA